MFSQKHVPNMNENELLSRFSNLNLDGDIDRLPCELKAMILNKLPQLKKKEVCENTDYEHLIDYDTEIADYELFLNQIFYDIPDIKTLPKSELRKILDFIEVPYELCNTEAILRNKIKRNYQSRNEIKHSSWKLTDEEVGELKKIYKLLKTVDIYIDVSETIKGINPWESFDLLTSIYRMFDNKNNFKEYMKSLLNVPHFNRNKL